MAGPFDHKLLVKTVGGLLDEPVRSPPETLGESQVQAIFDMAERLDDAVIIARLMLGRASRPQEGSVSLTH
jgi:hypothetical protein